MFGSVVLEVAIGLAFLYLLLSTVCSAANEWLAGLLSLRGTTLSAALRNLLDDSTVDAIYAHPLVQGLSGGNRPPSYIPARIFATTLLDVLNVADVVTGPAAAAAVTSRVAAIPNAQDPGGAPVHPRSGRPRAAGAAPRRRVVVSRRDGPRLRRVQAARAGDHFRARVPDDACAERRHAHVRQPARAGSCAGGPRGHRRPDGRPADGAGGAAHAAVRDGCGN